MKRDEIFFDFMWHIGVLDKFVINCINDRMKYHNSFPDVQKILKQTCNMTTLFVWHSTNEGWSYWYTVKFFGDALYNKMKIIKYINIEESFKEDLELILKSIDEGDELHKDYQVLIRRIKSYYYNRFPKIAIE